MYFRYRDGVPFRYRGGLCRRYHKGVTETQLGRGAAQLDSPAALFNELGDESCPSGLVAGPEPGAVVPMEVFMEKMKFAPLGIALKFFELAIHGTTSI